MQAKNPSLETNVINRVESTEPRTDLGAQKKTSSRITRRIGLFRYFRRIFTVRRQIDLRELVGIDQYAIQLSVVREGRAYLPTHGRYREGWSSLSLLLFVMFSDSSMAMVVSAHL